jgi:hypothetical protein
VAFNAPFQPLPGNTIGFTAGTSSQSRQVTPANFGLTQWPAQLRIYNNGTVLVWFWFSAQTITLTIPIPGTNNVGTPSPGIPLVPGILEIYSLTGYQGGSFWISDISTSNSQNYYLTPGEGL